MSSVESLRSSSPSGARRFVFFVAFCVEDNWATRPLDVTHSVQASPCFCEVAFIRVHSRLTPPRYFGRRRSVPDCWQGPRR
jgi:hypothetical protein